MKKLTGMILVGAMAFSMGTQAFAAGTNNGNHYGWEKGKQNPHKSEVTPTDDDIKNPTENTVPQETINAIVNDLNHSELNQYSTLNARYENGWIKIDNINFNLYLHGQAMSIVHSILDNHNLKMTDYDVENVQYEHPMATNHWGTVCFKVDKK